MDDQPNPPAPRSITIGTVALVGAGALLAVFISRCRPRRNAAITPLHLGSLHAERAVQWFTAATSNAHRNSCDDTLDGARPTLHGSAGPIRDLRPNDLTAVGERDGFRALMYWSGVDASSGVLGDAWGCVQRPDGTHVGRREFRTPDEATAYVLELLEREHGLTDRTEADDA
jgi:hypothetical protein